MEDRLLDELEKRLAITDVTAFNAIRELRLELRIMTRAFGELYGEKYAGPPPIYAHVRSS